MWKSLERVLLHKITTKFQIISGIMLMAMQTRTRMLVYLQQLARCRQQHSRDIIL